MVPCSKSLAIEALSPFPESLSCECLICDMKESRFPRTFPDPPLSSCLLVYKDRYVLVQIYNAFWRMSEVTVSGAVCYWEFQFPRIATPNKSRIPSYNSQEISFMPSRCRRNFNCKCQVDQHIYFGWEIGVFQYLNLFKHELAWVYKYPSNNIPLPKD